MGSDKAKDVMAIVNELPQHQLYLPEYRISRTLVTNSQYLRFVEATGQRSPKYWAKGKIPTDKEDHPVVNVSWRDAIAFCKWAGTRLPTEAEWEKAARGSDGRIWPWGNQLPDTSYCNFKDSGIGDTTPVGYYSIGASPYGVLDMGGNVCEWTRSQLFTYPYDSSDGRDEVDTLDESDGLGQFLSLLQASFRVLRGGAFRSQIADIRCAHRHFSIPEGKKEFYGFRLLSPGS